MLAMWPPTTIFALRLVLPDQLAHLLDLDQVGDDRRDADDVVLLRAKFRDEAVQRGEVQHVQGASMLAWISMMPQLR